MGRTEYKEEADEKEGNNAQTIGPDERTDVEQEVGGGRDLVDDLLVEMDTKSMKRVGSRREACIIEPSETLFWRRRDVLQLAERMCSGLACAGAFRRTNEKKKKKK
jgi:hypothetical protein